MGDSANALDRNAPGDSVGPQGRAIDALQRAGQGIVQQMMQQGNRGPGIGLNREFQPLQLRRDPLGRFMPNELGIDTRDVDIPDESAVERAQKILEELRHRAGQRHRPQRAGLYRPPVATLLEPEAARHPRQRWTTAMKGSPR